MPDPINHAVNSSHCSTKCGWTGHTTLIQRLRQNLQGSPAPVGVKSLRHPVDYSQLPPTTRHFAEFNVRVNQGLHLPPQKRQHVSANFRGLPEVPLVEYDCPWRQYRLHFSMPAVLLLDSSRTAELLGRAIYAFERRLPGSLPMKKPGLLNEKQERFYALLHGGAMASSAPPRPTKFCGST